MDAETAILLEKTEQKLRRYRESIDVARERGLFTRDTGKIEHCIRKIWKLQKKARSAMKRLPPLERRRELAVMYADGHQVGEVAVQRLLEFRAELLASMISSGLRAPVPEAAAPRAVDEMEAERSGS